MSSSLAAGAVHGPGRQAGVIKAAGAAAVALVALTVWQGGMRVALTGLIGVFAGLSLYHAAFGFSATWRRLFAERRSVGVRAQLVMIAATMLVSFPLLGLGGALGQSMTGFVNPVGVALATGALIFGVGMQLAGGCGSGTLYTAGGGSLRMLLALLFFILGSLLATADPLGWMSWPSLPSMSLIDMLGPWQALAVALLVMSVAYALLLRIETTTHGAVVPLVERSERPRFMASGLWLRGPWPLIAGALALALVNILTLLVAGRPWGITTAFALWGAKIAMVAGVDVSEWTYWRNDPSLTASVFADVTSVMDFGVMIGALLASGLAGSFRPQWKVPLPSLLAAVVGGLLMGIGARLGTGCNIGAFFSGLVSGSMHGIVWLIFAVGGSWIGMKLRPAFGLAA